MQPARERSLVDNIAREIRDRTCVLFFGAAIHAGPPEALSATWPPDQRPPMGSELSRRLACRSGDDQRRSDVEIQDLKRVSLDYEIQMGRPALVQAIRDEVENGKTPSPLLIQLAQMDFPVIVTTNYDTLFEQALRRAFKNPFVSSYKGSKEATV